MNAGETAPTDKTCVILRAYGPGGPAPAMREAAKAFGDKKGIKEFAGFLQSAEGQEIFVKWGWMTP